ncbi:hypothetical protein [Alkalimarinus sediminis]|uniref:Uncharacterized protein n=1 Tax=Alkalimarinus sediminis TaxID=1632866 RepID=A0A9E8HPQ1_9ALTE|nr:hypothetical protein [Alkalimarinus sediminis]UZW74246.1 hypothetical protein NNL22_14635 [Alkalimarinus sediminis]
MQFVSPIIEEQWVVDGQVHQTRPEIDALYITPLLNNVGLVSKNTRILHSLVLDNNILSDLIENRRPENTQYIKNILVSKPIELNPVIAMIEQRQKYSKATEALHEYACYLEKEFSWTAAKAGLGDFNAALETAKHSLINNIDLLSGYIGAIIYLYHQNVTSAEKLEWLSGMVQHSDLPFFQLQFYFAALMFLSKDKPELFCENDLKKIKKDMKLANCYEKQKKQVMNISNDLALPAVSIFPASTTGNMLTFPYIATRDRLVQLFLSEVTCGMVQEVSNGRANGAWHLRKGRLVSSNLGEVVSKFLPQRLKESTKEQVLIRKLNLRVFSELYIRKCVELRAFD